MNELNSGKPKSWDVYSGNDTSAPQTGGADNEAPWRNFGTSLNAISFGFVATAILISMFLIMAIFEHLLRPKPSFPLQQDGREGSLELGIRHDSMRIIQKLGNSQTVSPSYSSDVSVLMPGQHYPTFIAQPAPFPCPREGVYWPQHDHGFVHPQSL
ncbi:hypothetical protein Syun_002956 [Stephania yunnanensis]|uniref:Uncharacterized protein n=1 Tax=Stephania yunnanensis TaxID=152371 RepID=A0AAP0Q162_9MAGN